MTGSDLRQSYGLGWTYVALSLLRAVWAVLLGQVLASLWFLGLAASAARLLRALRSVSPAGRRSFWPSSPR